MPRFSGGFRCKIDKSNPVQIVLRFKQRLYAGPIDTIINVMTSLSNRTSLPTFVAGGAAGCTAAVLTCPLEVIKTKLQSRSLARASFLSVVRTTWLTEGYRGFFRGLVPLLSGEGPAAAPERCCARIL